MPSAPAPSEPDLPTAAPAAAGASSGSASAHATRAASRRAEIELLTRFAAQQQHGLLAPARVGVSGGSSVHVDGVDATGTLFVEAHAYRDALAPAQTDLVAQDLFKLALVARTHPSARAVLLLAGHDAARSVRILVRAVPSLSAVELVVVEA